MDDTQPSCASHLPAAQGASLKDADLVRWLQNKLQDREKWAGREGVQYVSREMVEELMTCFSTVENQTKLKIILSFLYLSPRLSKQWRESLVGLLGIARRDPDDWVEVISELFRNVPMASGARHDVEDLPSYTKMIQELKEIAETHEKEGNLRTDPPSFDISNDDVITSLFGKEPESEQHFSIRKKPKSDLLFQEIKKQSEMLNNQKKDKKEAIISGSLPIKIRSTRREANNALPMRGIPQQNTVKMSQGFTNEPKKFPRQTPKREGGVKLLDIGDLPLSLKQRRQAEREDEKRRAMEEKEQQKKAKEEEKKNQMEAKKIASIRAKEDAKLAEEKKVKMEKVHLAASKQDGTMSSRAPIMKRIPLPPDIPPPKRLPVAMVQPMRQNQQASMHLQQENFQEHQDHQNMPDPTQMQAQMQMQHLQQQQHQQQQHPLHHPQRIVQIPPMRQQQQIQQHYQGIPQQQAYNPNGHQGHYPGASAISLPGSSQQQMPQHTYLIATNSGPNQGIIEFQDLDVARKCQEILQSANALDDNGRNLVVQFMKGGLRCATASQSMEHIMTLKLSENIEEGLTDGRLQKLKVEVFFQMDLSNGEWKRLRKCRMLEGDEVTALMNQQQQQQAHQWQHQQYQQPQQHQQPQRFI